MVATRIGGAFRRFFVDPLAVKELSGIARRWQTYIGRCLYAGLIGIVIWIFWTSMTRRGGWMSPSAYAELGRTLFYSFFFLQLAVVTLGGMSAGADMITREIRGGTLGLLALTPLTPWRIVAGKWKAAVIQTSTALLCGGPVFAVCIYLGGAGLWEFAYSVTLSVLCAALGAALAILYSTAFRASYVVTIVTLITLLGYCIGPAILFPLLRFDEGLMSVLVYVHPLYAAIGVTLQGAVGVRSQWTYGWIGATGVTSLIILGLLRQAAARVRRLIRLPGGRAPEPPSLDQLRHGPAPAGPKTSALARFFRGQGGVWQSRAILWKELSTRRVGAGKGSKLGLAILLFFLLTTMGTEGWWRVLVLWFASFVLVLVALANGVSLFVTEREERKWDILLSTPLTAAEIVLAKLAAGLSGLAPMGFLMAVFWSLIGMAYQASAVGIGMTLVAAGLFILFTYLLAAFTSLNASSQRAAFSSAFGILLGLLCVVPILAAMFQSYRVLPTTIDYAEYVIGATNPGTYLAYVSEPLGRTYEWEGWREHYRARGRELVPVFLVFVGGYSALIAGLVVWMIHRFDRAAGRS